MCDTATVDTAHIFYGKIPSIILHCGKKIPKVLKAVVLLYCIFSVALLVLPWAFASWTDLFLCLWSYCSGIVCFCYLRGGKLSIVYLRHYTCYPKPFHIFLPLNFSGVFCICPSLHCSCFIRLSCTMFQASVDSTRVICRAQHAGNWKH